MSGSSLWCLSERVTLRPGDGVPESRHPEEQVVWLFLGLLYLICNKSSAFPSISLKLQGRETLERVQWMRVDTWNGIVPCLLLLLNSYKNPRGFPFSFCFVYGFIAVVEQLGIRVLKVHF